MNENPLDKAKKFKQIVEQQKQNQKVQKVSSLQKKLDEVIDFKKEEHQISGDFATIKNETDKIVTEGKIKRKTLQEEGKGVVRELKKDASGVEVLKNKDYVQEIFKDTISALKTINISVNSQREKFNLATENFEAKRKKYFDEKQDRLNKFLEEYPQIKEIQTKAEHNKAKIDYIKRQLSQITDFMESPDIKKHLSDEIIFNTQWNTKIIDKTLADHLENLDNQLDKVRSERYEFQNSVGKLKKGFFESKEEFDIRKENLWEQAKKMEYEQESPIFHGENGKQKTQKIKDIIEKQLDHYFRNFFNDYEKGVALVKDKNSVGAFIQAYRENIEQQQEQYSLTEEEQLIVELNNELWR